MVGTVNIGDLPASAPMAGTESIAGLQAGEAVVIALSLILDYLNTALLGDINEANANLEEALLNLTSGSSEPVEGALVIETLTRKWLLGFNGAGDTKLNGLELTRVVADDNGILDLIGVLGGQRTVYYNTHTGQFGVGSFDDATLLRAAPRLESLISPQGIAGDPDMSNVIDYHPSTGQSLDWGGGLALNKTATPILSAAPPSPYGLMANTGPRGRGGSVLDGDTLTSFMKLVEIYDAANGLGETQAGGLVAQMDRRQAAREKRAWSLVRSHAEGGQPLADITVGTQPYLNGLIELERFIAIAAARGKTLRAPVLSMTHGENDRQIGTLKEDYKDGLIALRAGYNADWLPLLQAQMGQEAHPAIAVAMHQLAANASGIHDASPISIGMWELARDLPTDFFLIAPGYIYSHLAEPGMTQDDAHRPASAYRLMGEYRAIAWARWVYDGLGHPMMPTFTVDGGDLVVTCAGAVGDAVFNTDWLADHPGGARGFEWDDSVGGTITNVTGSGKTIRITPSGSPTGMLRYAYTKIGATPGLPAAWGNVHDSATLPCVSDPSLLLPNWLNVFEHSFT